LGHRRVDQVDPGQGESGQGGDARVKGGIRVTDAAGKQSKMPEEDRQARIEEAQRGIVAN